MVYRRIHASLAGILSVLIFLDNSSEILIHKLPFVTKNEGKFVSKTGFWDIHVRELVS